MLPTLDPRHAANLRKAAAKNVAEAQRLFGEVPVMVKATKTVASVSYMLWTGSLAMVGICAIIPVWLLVLFAGFGYLLITSAARQPGQRAYAEAERLMFQAKEAEEQADQSGSSGLTLDDMGASRN